MFVTLGAFASGMYSVLASVQPSPGTLITSAMTTTGQIAQVLQCKMHFLSFIAFLLSSLNI